MAKGLLYFAQNPAFQHLTKIGKTAKLDVEDRGLSASNVPEDFQYLRVFECEDADAVEKKVHKQFDDFRHVASSSDPKKKGRKTEFFWSGCIEDAIVYTSDLKGVVDKTDDETEEVEVIDDGERQTRRRTQTTFEMLNIPKGSKLLFENDKNRVATTLDNKNKILFEGKVGSISKIAEEALGAPYNISGTIHFFYKGKSLWDLRPDRQLTNTAHSMGSVKR